jgi:DDE family transposase
MAAAFANPAVYEFLETEGYGYVIGLPANEMLQREIEPLLTRPVGRPANAPVVWYTDFLYQAQSWERARRVVAKVEWHIFRELATTLKPRSTNAFTIPAPIPCEAPVTMAVFRGPLMAVARRIRNPRPTRCGNGPCRMPIGRRPR